MSLPEKVSLRNCIVLLAGVLIVLSGIFFTAKTIHRNGLFVDDKRYWENIQKISRRRGIDPQLVRAVIFQESRFKREAIGKKGEIGLMQIMVDRAASDWARVKKYPLPSAGALYDPELNIEIGSWYLGRALRRWRNFKESVPLALCEYNAGLTRARKWQPETSTGDVISRIRINSTKQYVKDILKRYQKYKNEWKAPH